MKKLPLFESMNENLNTRDEISIWLDSMGIRNYTINGDLTVDVKGDADLSGKNLLIIPVQFGRVSGDFSCRLNKLTSLQGAPNSVDGSFNCRDNQLTSLQGAPSSVSGHFNCRLNQLTSLRGAPSSVGVTFDCAHNKLTSLQGAPSSVGVTFYCRNNQLTSLQGAPNSVGGDFNCRDNELTSLQGAPSSVDGSFYCGDNMIPLGEFVGLKMKVGGTLDGTNQKPVESVSLPHVEAKSIKL